VVVQQVRNDIEEKDFSDTGHHDDDEKEADQFRGLNLFLVTSDVRRKAALG
jgi:hypothetical protein